MTTFLPISPTPWATGSNLTYHVTNHMTSSSRDLSQCATFSMSVENVLYTLFMMLVLLFSVGGNVIVMLAVLMSPSLKRRCTFYFVASLACSDLLVALFSIPFKISVKLHGVTFCLGLSACYFQILLDVFGNIASILNLLLISVDRFIAIQMPYKYVDILSSKTVKRLVIATWVFAAFWSLVGIYKWEDKRKPNPPTDNTNSKQNKFSDNSKTTTMSKSNTSSTQLIHVVDGDHISSKVASIYSIQIDRVCQNTNTYYFLVSFYAIYIPVLITMTCVYVKILAVAVTQIRKIKRHKSIVNKSRRLALTPQTTQLTEMMTSSTPKRSRKWSLGKELHATKSVAIVYLAFCVCWLPSCVITTIVHADEDYFHRLQISNEALFLAVYYTFVEILPLVNTMINPVIYSFSNTQFRNGVAAIWRKLVGKNQRRESAFTNSGRRRTSRQRSSCVSTTLVADYKIDWDIKDNNV